MKISPAWILKIVFLILLGVGLPYLHFLAGDLKSAVADKRLQLERGPDDVVYASAAKADLAKRQLDLRRIGQYMPDRGSLVPVVTAIEQEGGKRNVSVKVTDISEELTVNAAGQPIPASGPVQNIRIKVSAVGEPEDILQALYNIDHLPYLLYVASWDLVYKPQDSQLPPIDLSEEQRLQTAAGAMQADIIIATNNGVPL